MLTDTHCHLYLPAFDADRDAVMARAANAGVGRFYMPAIDSTCTASMELMEQAYPGGCFMMAGLHPCSVKENYRAELELIEEQLSKKKFAGIGETGLDYYWDTGFSKEQADALDVQARLALKYDLPLILHTRNATQETIDALKPYRETGLRGIFHCFGGTVAEAKQITAMGFFLGIGGVLTYKNAGLAETLADVDISAIVLETDAPYLAPVPFRGKRNESGFIVHTAQKLAAIKNISAEETAEITTANAEKIFGSQAAKPYFCRP